MKKTLFLTENKLKYNRPGVSDAKRFSLLPNVRQNKLDHLFLIKNL